MPGAPPSLRRIQAWIPAAELAGAALALALGFHFLALRIRTGGLPGGDEGSWMAVAAELAEGRGFTTRWLEAHFLVPYALPRPDDFRYPALTSLLALAFRLFGYSVETARWTVAAAFLAYAAAVWGVCRAAFGRWAALAALWTTVTSLLQLSWNSLVYTEGLFGLAAAGLAAWCLRGERTRGRDVPFGFRTHAWWAGLGAAVALMYLVRVNAILFLPGAAWLWFRRRQEPLRLSHPAAALAAFVLLASPWLIRTAVHFGSPFHFAGSGGLLRDPGSALTQSHTLTAAEYFGRHDLLFPLRRLCVGAARLARNLHEFEHGLEALPLSLAVLAAWRRRAGFGPAWAAGMALTVPACAYAAYNSWAGARYLSSLLPFAYAYGFSLVPAILARLGRPALRPAGSGLGLLLAIAPTVQPHRYYERTLERKLADAGPYAYRALETDHLARLAALVPPGGHYYAASLCDLNFLAAGRYCVGLQELYDPSWLPRSLAAFHPRLVALTRAELEDAGLRPALDRMRAQGCGLDTADAGAAGVYLRVRECAFSGGGGTENGDANPADGANAGEAGGSPGTDP
jgi:hypothetical protein